MASKFAISARSILCGLRAAVRPDFTIDPRVLRTICEHTDAWLAQQPAESHEVHRPLPPVSAYAAAQPPAEVSHAQAS